MDQLVAQLNSIKDTIMLELKDKVSESKLTEIENKLRKEIKDSIAEIAARNINLNLDEKDVKKFRFSKAILGIVDGNKSADWWDKNGAGFEKEVLEQTAKLRSNNSSSDSLGGVLIPTDVTGELIDLAIASMPMMELGLSVYRGLRGELPVPKITGRPTAYWVGEEEAATESQTTFGEVILRPRTLGAFTKLSRQLLYQSSGVAEQIVRAELAKAMALGMENGIINGTGTDKQPLGLLNMSGFTSTTAIGGDFRFKFKHANNMVNNIDVANMLKPTGKFGFLTRPEVKNTLKAERIPQFSGDTDGAYVTVPPVMSDAQLESQMGYKVRTTTLIPAASNKTSVVFGDFSQIMLGLWEGLEIKASDTAGNSSGSAFLQRQVWINAFQQLDVNVKDATGLTKVSDAATNLL